MFMLRNVTFLDSNHFTYSQQPNLHCSSEMYATAYNAARNMSWFVHLIVCPFFWFIRRAVVKQTRARMHVQTRMPCERAFI